MYIVNASYPVTLASLSLFVSSQVSSLAPTEPLNLRLALSLGALTFLLAAVSVFFYTVYPGTRRLWTVGAGAFLIGLLNLIVATALVIIAEVVITG